MSNKECCCCGGENKVTLDEKSQVIQNFYNAAAEGLGPYSNKIDKFSPAGPTEKIVQILKNSGKRKVLDLGCGMGTTLLRIVKEHDAEMLIGVDFSEKMIEKAKSTSNDLPEDLKKKVGFFTSNVSKLPYLDGQFDFIYSECVLNLVADRDIVLKEVNRVLAPGGIFIYTDFVSYETVPEEIRENLNVISGCRAGSITLDDNIKYMEQNGFDKIEKYDYTIEKTKRYKELLEDNPENAETVKQFEKDFPFVSKFLEEKIGYYVICGSKK